MAYVVTENCIMCKHTDCVSACPVDCFYEGPNFLVIHPDECIDCGVCQPECPIQAIAQDDDVPPDQRAFIEINRELALAWPGIRQKKAALPEAEAWKGKPGKLAMLQRP